MEEKQERMDAKQRRKNRCDVINCSMECWKCGFNPVVKEARLRKLFPNMYRGVKDGQKG